MNEDNSTGDPVILIPTPWRFVSEPAVMAEALEQFKGEEVIGVDTETYWDASTRRSRVSLAQIASRSGEVIVCDVLTAGVEPLRELVETHDIRMVAHNARFDEGVLRDAGLRPQGFIDTLQLSRRALTLPSYSLATVTEHIFGLPLDKTLRASNWRRRPLSSAQISYAALDARITLELFHELRRLLEGRGTWEAALRSSILTFDETRQRVKRRRATAPEIHLTADERRLFNALKKWRLAHSNTLRVPAYMICPDKTLECLARERPATVEALASIYGLGAAKISRFGVELLKALKEAQSPAD